MKLEFVHDIKDARRWISLWCMSVAGAIQGAWVFLSDDLKASIPPSIVQAIALTLLALLVVGVAGRVIKQAPPAPSADHPAKEATP